MAKIERLTIQNNFDGVNECDLPYIYWWECKSGCNYLENCLAIFNNTEYTSNL